MECVYIWALHSDRQFLKESAARLTPPCEQLSLEAEIPLCWSIISPHNCNRLTSEVYDTKLTLDWIPKNYPGLAHKHSSPDLWVVWVIKAFVNLFSYILSGSTSGILQSFFRLFHRRCFLYVCVFAVILAKQHSKSCFPLIYFHNYSSENMLAIPVWREAMDVRTTITGLLWYWRKIKNTMTLRHVLEL